MSIRRNPDHRPPRTPEGGPCPPVQQERLPALPPPGPEGGRGRGPPWAERDREDDPLVDPERRVVPEFGPLPPHTAVLERRTREIQGDGGARLPREDCLKGNPHGPEAAVRRQAPEGRKGHRAGPSEEGRPPRPPRRALVPPLSGLGPASRHRPPERRGAPAHRDRRDDAEGRG